jgi:hypothetical protein
MNCPKCNTENEASARFCKSCGFDLSKQYPANLTESYTYFGILALSILLMDIIKKVHYKIFLVIFERGVYENLLYKITLSLLEIIWFAIPVLIIVRIKNKPIKITVIALASILLLFQLLAIFDVYNWYIFWNKP